MLCFNNGTNQSCIHPTFQKYLIKHNKIILGYKKHQNAILRIQKKNQFLFQYFYYIVKHISFLQLLYLVNWNSLIKQS